MIKSKFLIAFPSPMDALIAVCIISDDVAIIFEYRIILCVRTEEQDARINGPMEDFVINWFNNIIEKKTYFQMNFVKNADDCKGIIEVKKETAQEIVKYIIDEISKQNEN